VCDTLAKLKEVSPRRLSCCFKRGATDRSTPGSGPSTVLDLCGATPALYAAGGVTFLAARASGPQLREIYFRLLDAHQGEGEGEAEITGRWNNVS
jgi:hypothetical protein